MQITIKYSNRKIVKNLTKLMFLYKILSLELNYFHEITTTTQVATFELIINTENLLKSTNSTEIENINVKIINTLTKYTYIIIHNK